MKPIIYIYKQKLTINSKVLIDNCSLSIEKGLSVGIFGKNGSGKTTLIKSILNNGYIDRNKFKIGYVIQNSEFSDKLIEIVYWFMGIKEMVMSKEKINRIFNFFELADKVKSYFSDLSEGQKQRFRLMLALFEKPDILILDEPLSALDFKMQNKLIKLIKQLKKENDDMVLILISHDVKVSTELLDSYTLIKNKEMSKLLKLPIDKKQKERHIIDAFSSI